MANLDSILKSRDFPLPTKVCLVKAVKTMVFPVVMYECKSWTIKKTEHQKTDAFKLWCWRRFLRVIWTARRSNQSILGGKAPWIFIGRTDAEAEALILWSPDSISLIGKDPDAGKDWGQAEKGVTEDEIFGWHHQLNGHEFEQTLGVGEGQGSLDCCSSSHKESDTAEWLSNNRGLCCSRQLTWIGNRRGPEHKSSSHPSLNLLFWGSVVPMAFSEISVQQSKVFLWGRGQLSTTLPRVCFLCTVSHPPLPSDSGCPGSKGGCM